ncbi:hypothetical protein AX16_006515 [Volvariella volvacea WC 439]|nr:hypothetical protein AX16_006515 [Volvariella volvacea WC 439]
MASRIVNPRRPQPSSLLTPVIPSSSSLSPLSATSSSSRLGISNLTTVGATTTNVLSVEDWESKAQLSDLELNSIAVVKQASEKPPLPAKFVNEDPNASSRPGTPSSIYRSRFGIGSSISRPTTPSSPTSIPTGPGSPTPNLTSTTSSTTINITTTGATTAHPLSQAYTSTQLTSHILHPKHPIQTPQQFYDWFALIDRSVAHSQESHFRAHVAGVKEYLEVCDMLVDRIESVEGELESMMIEWTSVEESGKSLKGACERLLEERDQLLQLTEEIGTRLEYFQELEHATRMLNHPGESLVLQTDFLYMVERVDVCIEYLKAHRHFKEAEVYLLRFQQCMTRAMTLIKMYFVGSLRALSADVSRRLSEKDVSQTAQMHLLYTRFKSTTSQLTPLLNELERRAQAHPEELSALLTECHAAYFATRKSLLVGRLMEEIRGLDPGRTELVELTRAGCSYLKQLCTDEFNLFREFFNSGEEQLYQYLEGLCDYLYDDLRPRILHEPKLTALCEVCTVLQALMVIDSAIAKSYDDDEDELITNGQQHAQEDANQLLSTDLDQGQAQLRGKKGRSGLDQLHISYLLQMVLQDAQTRLFFKAQSVIQSDIRHYAPKAEDLAYPDLLVAARKPATGYEIKEKESFNQIFRLPSLDKQGTWYPTLRKTVWVLSQLHDFVKPAIFEDIAQEAVSLCRTSLIQASEIIKSRNPPQSILDGQLFLVRHLLILKEIAGNLSLVQRDVESDIDFAGVTDALANMLSKTTSLLPEALFSSLGMPRAEESIKETKHGIDHELRRACEEVIAMCSDPVCQPIEAWTSLVRTHRTKTLSGAPETDAPPSELTEQYALTLESQFHEALHRDLRANVTRLRLYLEDDRTVGVLVAHMQDRVMDEYAEFKDIVKSLPWYEVGSGALRDKLLSPTGLRDILRDACGEDEGAVGPGSEASGSGGANGSSPIVSGSAGAV